MTRAPRRRAPRGAGNQLREPIVAAARRLLTEKGDADAVSIRAVADVVGVTPPSIYLHFADKDELLSAVVADVFAELNDRIVAVSAEPEPLERLLRQGRAYVRFALEAPEQYRLATMTTGESFSHVDSVLTTAAFDHLRTTVGACMSAGIFAPADATPVALDLLAAAHGIASMLITKPYLPWGDVDDAVYRVLSAAAMGHAIGGYLHRPSPAEFRAWHRTLPPRTPEDR